MNWLKLNLFLIIGCAVTLLLLGLAGFYLYTQVEKESTVSNQLEAQMNDWRRLTTRVPSVNEDNIVLARTEQKKLADLFRETRQYFAPATTLTNIDTSTFRHLLDTTLFELEQSASRQGVALPPNYAFTVDWVRRSVVFDQAELLPLAHQLAEIQELCEMLFDARIHSLVRLRRVPISTRDQGSNDYLQGMKPITNAVTRAVVMPYEITFQGFTAELAEVLDTLQRTPLAVMVKTIDVESGGAPPSRIDAPAAAPGTPLRYAPPMRSGAPTGEELMRDRYGVSPGGARSPYGGRAAPGDRYRPTPGSGTGPALVPFTGAGRRGPETVLEEELLKVTMVVEVVRLPAPIE
jgi:type II secretory pathway pseudopilin PulG